MGSKTRIDRLSNRSCIAIFFLDEASSERSINRAADFLGGSQLYPAIAKSTAKSGDFRGLEGTASFDLSCNFLILTVLNVGSNPTLSATLLDLFYQALELPALRA